MAKRISRRTIGQATEGTPRLGTVLRFKPQAARSGIKQLEGSGFRVASSKDFRSAASVPNDLDGADVQYFERFGIAIVRRDGERLRPMVEKAMQQKVVSGFDERGCIVPSDRREQSAPMSRKDRLGAWRHWIQTIFGGIAMATNELIDRLLGREGTESLRAAARFDETTATWGLEATKVVGSSLTGRWHQSGCARHWF